jgi:hypothetical protein
MKRETFSQKLTLLPWVMMEPLWCSQVRASTPLDTLLLQATRISRPHQLLLIARHKQRLLSKVVYQSPLKLNSQEPREPIWYSSLITVIFLTNLSTLVMTSGTL